MASVQLENRQFTNTSPSTTSTNTNGPPTTSTKTFLNSQIDVQQYTLSKYASKQFKLLTNRNHIVPIRKENSTNLTNTPILPAPPTSTSQLSTYSTKTISSIPLLPNHYPSHKQPYLGKQNQRMTNAQQPMSKLALQQHQQQLNIHHHRTMHNISSISDEPTTQYSKAKMSLINSIMNYPDSRIDEAFNEQTTSITKLPNPNNLNANNANNMKKRTPPSQTQTITINNITKKPLKLRPIKQNLITFQPQQNKIPASTNSINNATGLNNNNKGYNTTASSQSVSPIPQLQNDQSSDNPKSQYLTIHKQLKPLKNPNTTSNNNNNNNNTVTNETITKLSPSNTTTLQKRITNNTNAGGLLSNNTNNLINSSNSIVIDYKLTLFDANKILTSNNNNNPNNNNQQQQQQKQLKFNPINNINETTVNGEYTNKKRIFNNPTTIITAKSNQTNNNTNNNNNNNNSNYKWSFNHIDEYTENKNNNNNNKNNTYFNDISTTTTHQQKLNSNYANANFNTTITNNNNTNNNNINKKNETRKFDNNENLNTITRSNTKITNNNLKLEKTTIKSKIDANDVYGINDEQLPSSRHDSRTVTIYNNSNTNNNNAKYENDDSRSTLENEYIQQINEVKNLSLFNSQPNYSSKQQINEAINEYNSDDNESVCSSSSLLSTSDKSCEVIYLCPINQLKEQHRKKVNRKPIKKNRINTELRVPQEFILEDMSSEDENLFKYQNLKSNDMSKMKNTKKSILNNLNKQLSANSNFN